MENFEQIVMKDPNHQEKRTGLFRLRQLRKHNQAIAESDEANRVSDNKEEPKQSGPRKSKDGIDLEFEPRLSNAELPSEPQVFADVFRIGTDGLIIPFERLDEVTILKNIDLTYYQSKCREILK